MKFIVDAGDFCKVVQLAMRTTDRKDPVKSCIKLEAKKGVRVLSTTGHSGSCLDAKAQVAVAGESIVPADSFLKALRQCEFDTRIEIKDNNILITNGQLEYKVLTSATKAFPFTEKSKFDTYLVDLHEMVAAMKIVEPTTDTVRESEYKGVGLTPEGGSLRLSAMSASSAGGYSSLLKSKGTGEADGVIIDAALAGLIISLSQEETYSLSIGIDRSSIAVKHALGYTYLPQLTARPFEVEKYKKLWKLETKPICVTAGLFAKAVRSVLVMGDKEEGYTGKLVGGKGTIEVSSYSNMTGKARNSVITAGDLEVNNWYNFRTLHGYLSAVAPEEEFKIHTVSKSGSAALIVRYLDHIFWLASCAEPEGVEKDAKSKRKEVS